MNEVSRESIDTLNSLLGGELSAVQTYEQAVSKLSDSSLVEQLRNLRVAHLQRAQRLEREVVRLGGEPKRTSGIWGAFANFVETAAASMGERPAIATLEEGEDKGLNDYRRALTKLDEPVRKLVESELLPGQEQTHSIMSNLKRTLQ